MADAYGLKCCPSDHAPKSELSRRSKDHHSFVPKLNHHGGKTIALRAKKQKEELPKGGEIRD